MSVTLDVSKDDKSNDVNPEQPRNRPFISDVLDVLKADMFNSIVMGKDVTEIIKTSKGEFKVKYPRARDIQAIGRLQAYRLNGVSTECFDKNANTPLLAIIPSVIRSRQSRPFCILLESIHTSYPFFTK